MLRQSRSGAVAEAEIAPNVQAIALRKLRSRYCGLPDGFFLGLQADHDLMERHRQIHGDLSRITPRVA